jgi:hypothetical protein
MSILIASFNYRIRRLNSKGEEDLQGEGNDL